MHEVRCHYDVSLYPKFDEVLYHLVGRVSNDSGARGFGPGCAGQRDHGWKCYDETEVARVKDRLATCPEVTIVETTDGD